MPRKVETGAFKDLIKDKSTSKPIISNQGFSEVQKAIKKEATTKVKEFNKRIGD
jgi:hypothetical protein